MTHSQSAFPRSLLAITALLMLVGCGSDEGTTTVEGNVTLDGEPLPDGLIAIYPLSSGKPNEAAIVDGRYSIPAELGKYKVEISRLVSTDIAMSDSDYGIEHEQKESILPRYNSNSELRMEVKANGERTFDFRLTSKK